MQSRTNDSPSTPRQYGLDGDRALAEPPSDATGTSTSASSKVSLTFSGMDCPTGALGLFTQGDGTISLPFAKNYAGSGRGIHRGCELEQSLAGREERGAPRPSPPHPQRSPPTSSAICCSSCFRNAAPGVSNAWLLNCGLAGDTWMSAGSYKYDTSDDVR